MLIVWACIEHLFTYLKRKVYMNIKLTTISTSKEYLITDLILNIISKLKRRFRIKKYLFSIHLSKQFIYLNHRARLIIRFYNFINNIIRFPNIKINRLKYKRARILMSWNINELIIVVAAGGSTWYCQKGLILRTRGLFVVWNERILGLNWIKIQFKRRWPLQHKIF